MSGASLAVASGSEAEQMAAVPPQQKQPATREIFQASTLFRLYVIVGTTIGLFLPLAYVLGGFASGDEHAVRALVPMIYTIRRIFVILDWINDVLANKTLPANAELQDIGRYWFGRSLAVAKMVYFSINLFGFLIPRFLPRAFERYFKESPEIYAKTAEDKRSAAINKPQPPVKKTD